MDKHVKKLTVDRIEEGIIVAFSDSGEKYISQGKLANISENDIIMATITDDFKILSARVLAEETKTKINSLKERLKSLFSKRGKYND